MLKQAALGFRAHSGWAAMVAVAGPVGAPAVVLRGRVELCDRHTARVKQPYHTAAGMELPEARAFLERCAAASATMAGEGIRKAMATLADKGFTVAGCGVLLASGRPTPDLAKTLGSHPMIHTAEGEFYREAVRRGCEARGVGCLGVKERELLTQASATLHIPPDELQRWAAEWRTSMGPPWRQDEKLSAIAAWLVLADSL